MYNFFIDKENIDKNLRYVKGSDYNHIKNVLRMKEGDTVLVSCLNKSDLCKIVSFNEDLVLLEVVEENYNDTSLPIKVCLFQGLPKSDKLELIIQKAVELGADKIIPVQMARSIVKIDKKKDNKTARYNAIAESAGKQSKRNSITEVLPPMTFSQSLSLLSALDLIIVPYECEDGMQSTLSALKEIKSGMKVGVFIGPEGGFDDKEIDALKERGAKIVSLGKRILRTETAAITALSMLMLYAEINL
ncbi:MAG: 16S rRNA (uracil(1498)-N(3))-methyltransferase [Clostridia bacterium]|nr:16S rRNA (uracil(1498)-N(3))-methyltransferase [Clostridia bacterium]